MYASSRTDVFEPDSMDENTRNSMRRGSSDGETMGRRQGRSMKSRFVDGLGGGWLTDRAVRSNMYRASSTEENKMMFDKHDEGGRTRGTRLG